MTNTAGRKIHSPFLTENSEISVSLPGGHLLGVYSPHATEPCENPPVEVRRALQNPVGMPPLEEAVQGCKKILIISDDITRLTPLKIILPEILEDLNKAGISDDPGLDPYRIGHSSTHVG